MTLVVPAVLPTSRDDLDEKLSAIGALKHVDRVQIDVVDGKFATPACWPYTAPEEFAKRIAEGWMLPHLDRIAYEIDLMCLDAEEAADEWVKAGASRLTFHVESTLHLGKLLTRVREQHGCGDISCDLLAVGVALNVDTDLSLIEPYVDQIDYVQFMGIATIGKQGQPFDERVVRKLQAFHAKHPHVALQVDGAMSLRTAPAVLAQGVTHLVVGSALLRAAHPEEEIKKFEALVHTIY